MNNLGKANAFRGLGVLEMERKCERQSLVYSQLLLNGRVDLRLVKTRLA